MSRQLERKASWPLRTVTSGGVVLALAGVLCSTGCTPGGGRMNGTRLEAEERGYQLQFDATLGASRNAAEQLTARHREWEAARQAAAAPDAKPEVQQRVTAAMTQKNQQFATLQNHANQVLSGLDRTLPPAAFTAFHVQAVRFFRQCREARGPDELLSACAD